MSSKLDLFFNQDKYISTNEYEAFIKKHYILKNLDLLNERNAKYIKRKLIEDKEYLDTLFTSVGENIFLDDEQREIILRDDDYCLINAGAGSGKSTTMAAKVKYLIDKQHINPKDIIMLSFTKKSSEDLDEKVNFLLNLDIPVSTFHSLGMNFIRKHYPFPVQVASEDEQKRIICKYISNLFKDKEKLSDLVFLFKCFGKNYFFANGFIENYSKFDTFEDYFSDYKKRKYLKESVKPGGIAEYIKNRLDSDLSLFTIKGEKCKSLSEVKIANFLYMNGIDYSYEQVFEERVDESRAYSPDFTVSYSGKKIYIEYFGLSSCYENNELIQQNVRKYNRIRKQKEYFQSTHNYDFINLDYKTADGMFIDTLKKELEKRNIVFTPKTTDEIFYRLLDNNLQAEFFSFTSLIIKFIDILKNMLVDSIDYIFEKRITEISKEKFTYFYYDTNPEKEASYRIQALYLLKDIYNHYQQELTHNCQIDYSDMINLSYQYIIKEVKNSYPDLHYKYIIVDEYQDITFQRFLFVKRLVEYFNAKLITVGDDWQSIYAFNGSRLDLFNEFSKLFPNSKDDMVLSTTYRYGQELADISSKFILANQEQSQKTIKAIKHLEHPIEIISYSPFEEIKTIHEIVHQIYNSNPNHRILLLARTNKILNQITQTNLFSQGINDVIICNDLPNAKIEALTMHRSKGLTADQVIVFGLRKKAFPSKGFSEHWIFDYFKLDTINEAFPFAEERRLFYVSLTRTKNKVYLVVPQSEALTSSFVKELKENCIS